jgi:2-C-methyl-D-erythritol 4-phosphate cytidylyltransferase/2-C-methyl-D-erythritol 2,4-cyclodiphosphate synthase
MNKPKSSEQPDCVALIVSSGRGHRFGGEIPKQYLKLGGQSVLVHSIKIFQSHPRIEKIRVVIHPDDQELYDDAVLDLVLLNPIFGGDTRQDSVRLGLESFHDITPKSILIHDAARPFINTHIINQLLETLDEGELGVIPGILQTDTLKRAKNNIVTDTIDRTDLWSVQTPQAFNYQAILKAHRYAGDTQSTDDSSIMEQSGTKVIIIQGSNENFKITIADDLTRGERCLLLNEAQKVTRIGIGFDVHRFESGKSVILCGIEIPFSKSLEGHSDADVGMHAITDALFGAIGVGDIGLFFPPNDPQWKDVSSDVFLSRAGKEIANYGAAITNIDLTIICEAPKIANYRDLMRNNIANILNISYAQINIKGTTTERLGFTGRGEGIAAEAVASVTM